MILITTYYSRSGDQRFLNRRQYLEQTIQSVDSQNLDNLFHLIVDDGSTDDMYSVLSKKYADHPTRRVIRREKSHAEPLSSTNARNYAIELCLKHKNIAGIDISNHKYISFTDSDDLVANLGLRLSFMEKNQFSFGYSDAFIFFDNDIPGRLVWKALNPQRAYKNFWIFGKMPYPTMCWRKDFLEGLTLWVKRRYGFDGPFDPNIGCAEDVDIALSSFEYAKIVNTKIGYIPEVTAGYRIHQNSLAEIREQGTRKTEEHKVLIRHFGRMESLWMYVKRAIVRPEFLFPSLIKLRNRFRKKFVADV